MSRSGRRRVIVLGGYGNFGSRLVDDLAGHPEAEVVIAGRHPGRARKAAEARGLAHVVCDTGDPASLQAAFEGAFLVLHAAGPFQWQGHAVARAALDAGAHLLDLADGREHVLSMSQFDERAADRGLLLASGASTVCALTDAMVAALAPEFVGLESIDIGLAPGNRNPRGAATVTSVLAYAGRPVRVFENGHWNTHLGWGEGRSLDFPAPVGRRTVHLCDVPDLELFPERWGAPTVRFCAGLELPLLDGGLAWLARRRPRSAMRFGRAAWAASLATRWRGTAAGAVAVWLRGFDCQGQLHTRSLALVTPEDGPAAPCAPALLLARRLLEQAPPRIGAGPATGLLTLDELMTELGPRGFERLDGDGEVWFSPDMPANQPVTDAVDLASHWTLDPEVVFLNHGSFGACPKVVLAEQQALRARLERQPVKFMVRELEALADEARRRLGATVGAPPDDLGFVTNATSGVNTVLRSIDWQPGDELLVTDQGYNACKNAAVFVTERAGARVVTATLPFPLADSGEVVEAVLAAVTPRTQLLLIDHVTSPTGLVLPVAELIAALRERGVETLVDGAHAPGMLPLDITALGPAYYTANAHKWLCAPKGVAFLYVRPDLQPNLRPLAISHGANSTRSDRSRFRLEFDWTGTSDPTAMLSLPATFDFFDTVVPGGLPEVMRRNHALALEARDIVAPVLNLSPPAPDASLGSLVAMPLPGLPEGGPASPLAIDPLQEALYVQHGIEVLVTSWGLPENGPPRRALRLSAQLYNTPAHYQRLAAALDEILHA